MASGAKMGKSGAVRTNALNASQVAAMVTHEYRDDLVAEGRIVRNTPALVYSPYFFGLTDENPDRNAIDQKIEELDRKLHPSITDACEHHLFNIRRNKAARKLCLHSIVQFPTDLPITPETERQMLVEAVSFINETFGGDAVFHARLDRDEAGRHAVDVFYAPRYLKETKRKSEHWVSLTKHGKELAEARFGEKEKKRKNKDTDEWDPVLDDDGNPVMVLCNSQYYQGRALQDAFYEHLRDKMHLDWAVRGEQKVGRDPDRVEVEQYKFDQERKKRAAERHQEQMEISAAQALLEPLRPAVAALEAFEAWKAEELAKDIRAAAELKAADILFNASPHWGALAVIASGDEVFDADGEYVAGGFDLGLEFKEAGISVAINDLTDFRVVYNAIQSAGSDARGTIERRIKRNPSEYEEWDDTSDALRGLGRAWSRVGTWSRDMFNEVSGAAVGLIKKTYDRLVSALVTERKAEIEATSPPLEAAPLSQMPEEAQEKIRLALAANSKDSVKP
jgi:hypothetical protein